MFTNDKRIVLTLDAGGTNFVFSAIQGYREIVTPIRLHAAPDDIDRCLATLENGFRQVMSQLSEAPSAISFAFPGPADYERGIIGDLPNFPAFRGGVALGPYLQERFGLPVFINNDGNLFAYGEALAGFLPEVNDALEQSGSKRRYHNLLGITLGTGFGAGVVINGALLRGDNGCGGDVWCMRGNRYPALIAEEGVSIRAVKRVYAERTTNRVPESNRPSIVDDALTPFDIFQIAEGQQPGDAKAAAESFHELGLTAGEAIASALDIVDGLVVIGGGLAGAGKYILPGVMEALNGQVGTFSGSQFPLLQMKAYNWEDDAERAAFTRLGMDQVCLPHSTTAIPYLRQRSTCVGLSRLGASTAIMQGAYAYALNELNK